MEKEVLIKEVMSNIDNQFNNIGTNGKNSIDEYNKDVKSIFNSSYNKMMEMLVDYYHIPENLVGNKLQEVFNEYSLKISNRNSDLFNDKIDENVHIIKKITENEFENLFNELDNEFDLEEKNEYFKEASSRTDNKVKSYLDDEKEQGNKNCFKIQDEIQTELKYEINCIINRLQDLNVDVEAIKYDTQKIINELTDENINCYKEYDSNISKSIYNNTLEKLNEIDEKIQKMEEQQKDIEKNEFEESLKSNVVSENEQALTYHEDSKDEQEIHEQLEELSSDIIY